MTSSELTQNNWFCDTKIMQLTLSQAVCNKSSKEKNQPKLIFETLSKLITLPTEKEM